MLYITLTLERVGHYNINTMLQAKQFLSLSVNFINFVSQNLTTFPIFFEVLIAWILTIHKI